MTVRLYFDHNVSFDAVIALRRQGLDVLTAYEDGRHRTPDTDLLDRATALRRVLVTHDHDLLTIAARRNEAGIEFYGVVFVHQDTMPLGALVRELEYVGSIGEPRDLANRVEYLPLR